jgi:hypothetical protein
MKKPLTPQQEWDVFQCLMNAAQEWRGLADDSADDPDMRAIYKGRAKDADKLADLFYSGQIPVTSAEMVTHERG